MTKPSDPYSRPTIDVTAGAQAVGPAYRVASGTTRDALTLADEWSKARTHAEFDADPLASEFRASLNRGDVPACSGLVLDSVRAIDHLGFWKRPRTEDVGPPPACLVKEAGRYNTPHNPVLYLSETVDGAVSELRACVNPIWVQRYAISLRALRIADIVTLPAEHVVNRAFWCAERVNRGGRIVPARYFFGTKLADEIGLAGFHGVRYPGAHSPSHHHVVVFEPGVVWRTWVKGDPWRLPCRETARRRIVRVYRSFSRLLRP